MFIIEGDGPIKYQAIDDVTLLFMKDDGDEQALAELIKRHPNLIGPAAKTFDVGSEAVLKAGDYSQRVVVKSARGDGYYQVENIATGKTGWVSANDLD